jgi:Beta-lactamase enzyme family
MKTVKRFQGSPAIRQGAPALAALVLLAGCTPNLSPPGKVAFHRAGSPMVNAKTRSDGGAKRSRSNVRAEAVADAPPASDPKEPAGNRRMPPLPAASDPKGAAGGGWMPPPPTPVAFATEGAIPQRLGALVAEARRKRLVRAVGIALVDLTRGQAYGVAPHRVFRPASVIKLAVMVGAYQAAATMPVKAFERLQPDLRRMITVSDNPSTTRLVRRLGKARINAAMGALGLPGIGLQPKPSPRGVLVGSRADAAEVALLLAKLARREVVSRAASEEMLLLLGAQQHRSRIPAGLTAQRGVWVGNKTGTLPGLVHDAGIVIDTPSGLAYTLAIFTEGAPSERAGERLCAAISAEAYRVLQNQPARPPATGKTWR